ncbi:hypothetical protein K7X08_016147 [Anisodus acutangulus]|uniref:Small ribosomal subunit protein uS10 domain-containing protein n=1 Tax=Anisodus acutangulus TaxID=402998 RepID=A0A9Q1LFY8_9SOLA|nr:hypothetical protein K7X08_016147 [Anisodus acutangulus]
MAISSSSLSATIFPVCNSSSISVQPKFSLLSLHSNSTKLHIFNQSRVSTTKVFAALEVLDAQNVSADVEDIPAVSTLSVGGDSDKAAPKQKIRIKLRSYWVPLIEDSCKQIMDAARTTNAKTVGPVPLPTKKRIYCVLKSPHVHKDARFHFEIRTHQRLIDIMYPTAQTIDKLMLLDLPAGVDVEEVLSLERGMIGNNVSILHNVTLGGTGKVCGDRHPKIGDGVLIGAGTCVLGNVRIEDGAKIGTGFVVLMEVPARTTAVGNPARLIGGKANPMKLDKILSLTMDHTSHMSEWSDYVI